MRLRFVCLNLWLGGQLFDNMVDFLKREEPDILVLQEAYRSKDPQSSQAARSFDVLQEILKFSYGFFSANFLDKYNFLEAESGNAILSHFPIISERALQYDIPYRVFEVDPLDYTHMPRSLQHCEVDVNGKTLNVFNTQGIWGFDGKDNERRLAMGEMIAHEVAGKPHTILAGDFNVQEGGKTTNIIEKHVRNIFKGERTSSFNMKHKEKPGYAEAVVDMIFVSPDIKVISHFMPEDDVSDHRPLVCELEIL